MTIRAAPTILDRLRAETRPAHEAIERELDWERRVATADGYRDLLARFYGFHAAWEPRAADLIGDAGFFEPRRKAHLLAADLRHLGLTAADLARLPLCPMDGLMRTVSDALGAMYVLEGSTLGGQLIARRIAQTHGLRAGAGCAYYASYGPAVGAMWRDFRARLLAKLSTRDGEDATVRAAERTFERLRVWLDPRSRTAPANCPYTGEAVGR